MRAAPLIHARGRLERRDGVLNILVGSMGALQWNAPPSEIQERYPGDEAIAMI